MPPPLLLLISWYYMCSFAMVLVVVVTLLSALLCPADTGHNAATPLMPSDLTAPATSWPQLYSVQDPE
jgi:hypothetical protein